MYQLLLSRSPHIDLLSAAPADVGQMATSESRSLQQSNPYREKYVQWLNKDSESKACYDFIVTSPLEDCQQQPGQSRGGISRTTFVEVKTTRFPDLNVFELSLWEWQFATAQPKVNYHIYRVFNAADPSNCRVVILRDVLRLIQARRVKLCLAT